jgi:hypothetical protein
MENDSFLEILTKANKKQTIEMTENNKDVIPLYL